MIDTDIRNDSKLVGCAKEAGTTLGFASLATAAISCVMYFTAVKPAQEDRNTFEQIAKNAQPIGTDSYLLTVDVD
jgi:hypothetical protein